MKAHQEIKKDEQSTLSYDIIIDKGSYHKKPITIIPT
jgi:hypothetical protein